MGKICCKCNDDENIKDESNKAPTDKISSTIFDNNTVFSKSSSRYEENNESDGKNYNMKFSEYELENMKSSIFDQDDNNDSKEIDSIIANNSNKVKLYTQRIKTMNSNNSRSTSNNNTNNTKPNNKSLALKNQSGAYKDNYKNNYFYDLSTNNYYNITSISNDEFTLRHKNNDKNLSFNNDNQSTILKDTMANTNNKKISLNNYINRNYILSKLNNNKSPKLLEIYIKNQINKIKKLIENKNSFKNTTKYIIPNELIENSRNIKNLYNLDILNTDSGKTILSKDGNFGIKNFKSGGIYIGNIVDRKCDGYGKYYTPDDYIIYGIFKNNYLQNYGIIEKKRKKISYEGEFFKNNYDGYGIEMFGDGSIYYGEYLKNKKHGIGTYIWNNNDKYQGEFKNGLPDGLGYYNDSINRSYSGEWKNGKINGLGLFKWDDGRKYIGNFYEDKREGFGIFMWTKPKLKIYLGFWSDGKQNGFGKLCTPFKNKTYFWEDGKVVNRYKNNDEIIREIEKGNYENIPNKKYFKLFRLTLDDLLTIMLEL